MPITNPAVAMAVINEAKAARVWPGEMPADPAQQCSTANEIVALAQQAQAAGVQGDSVTKVFAAAAQDPGSGIQAPAGNPFGGAPQPQAVPVAAPVPQPAAAPVAAPPVAPPIAQPPVAQAPPVQAPQPQYAPIPVASDINQLIPNYDEIGWKDVVAAMETLTDDQLAFVKNYEAQEGERAKIINFQRHPDTQLPQQPQAQAAPPAPAPGQPVQSAPSGVGAATDPSQHASVEPWEGYKKAKIADIVETIENVLRTQGEAAKPLLAHVWAFEQANKGRDRLIKKLQDIATNGVSAQPAAQPPAAPPIQPGVSPEPPFQAQASTEAPAQWATPPQPAVPAPGGHVGQPEFENMVAPLDSATQRAQSVIAGEGLPIPTQVGQPPQIPSGTEITTWSNAQVRQTEIAFNACQSRAQYLLSIAEGHANDAKLSADKEINDWIHANSAGFDAKATDTSKRNTALQNSPAAQHAMRVNHEWSELSRQWRALSTIYANTAAVLSREQTGRESEAAAAR